MTDNCTRTCPVCPAIPPPASSASLLDPSHVAWVHVTSFAGAGTDNHPLEIEEPGDGVIVSRWIMAEPDIAAGT